MATAFMVYVAILRPTDVEKGLAGYGSVAGHLSVRTAIVSPDISKHLRKDLEGIGTRFDEVDLDLSSSAGAFISPW
jgi:hypothetical protein